MARESQGAEDQGSEGVLQPAETEIEKRKRTEKEQDLHQNQTTRDLHRSNQATEATKKATCCEAEDQGSEGPSQATRTRAEGKKHTEEKINLHRNSKTRGLHQRHSETGATPNTNYYTKPRSRGSRETTHKPLETESKGELQEETRGLHRNATVASPHCARRRSQGSRATAGKPHEDRGSIRERPTRDLQGNGELLAVSTKGLRSNEPQGTGNRRSNRERPTKDLQSNEELLAVSTKGLRGNEAALVVKTRSLRGNGGTKKISRPEIRVRATIMASQRVPGGKVLGLIVKT